MEMERRLVDVLVDGKTAGEASCPEIVEGEAPGRAGCDASRSMSDDEEQSGASDERATEKGD